MVKWLRIHLPMQGMWVQSLVGELGSHMVQSRLALHAHVPQLRPNAAKWIFLIFIIFIYLDALGLSWGTRDLLVLACGIYFLDQESNPGPLHWEHGVLTIGPPGKSSSFLLIAFCYPIGWFHQNVFNYSLFNRHYNSTFLPLISYKILMNFL